MLEALFRNISKISSSDESKSTKQSAHPNRIQIADYTPIIFSELAGRTLYRIEFKDIGRVDEHALTDVLPLWIIEPLINVSLISFFLFILKKLKSSFLFFLEKSTKIFQNCFRTQSISVI